MMNRLFMKKTGQWFFLWVVAAGAGCSNQKASRPEGDTLSGLEQSFKEAAAQYKVMMRGLPPDRFPKTYHPKTGQPETSGSGWWCSGFYPGTLLHLYEETGDTVLYNEALRIMGVLEKEKHN